MRCAICGSPLDYGEVCLECSREHPESTVGGVWSDEDLYEQQLEQEQAQDDLGRFQ